VLAVLKADEIAVPAGRQQDVEQVAAVHHQVGVAVTVPVGLAEGEGSEHRAVNGVHHDAAVRVDGHFLDGVQDAQSVHNAGGVGADLQSGADLAERCGLFQEVHLLPGPAQREGGRKPADAAPDYEPPRAAHGAGSSR
jgi:hypothetical protein